MMANKGIGDVVYGLLKKLASTFFIQIMRLCFEPHGTLAVFINNCRNAKRRYNFFKSPYAFHLKENGLLACQSLI